MAEKRKACITCKWRVKHPTYPLPPIGVCTRSPPTAVLIQTPQGPSAISMFPPVTDDAQICGEYAEAEVKISRVQ